MKRLLLRLRDDRGVAAIEFAIILPLLVGVVLFGLDGWLRIDQVAKMHSALQAGARYYQGGGSDDSNAVSLAISAWATPPADAQVTTARSCTCGGVVVACTTQCAPSNTLPHTYISLTASGTYTGLMSTQALTENNVVRVR